jgi:biopolymer transport protein TolQ
MQSVAGLDVAAMVASATAMVQAVMALLAVMSVWSWSIIFWKLASLTRAKRAATRGLESFESAGDLDSGLHGLQGAGASPLLSAARGAIASMGPEGTTAVCRAGGSVVLTMRRAGMRGVNDLAGSIGFLAATAASAPFIGLFGTVWGIMHAFSSLGASANVTLALVAPGIAEALVATAMGLFTAIPASLAFNAMTGMLDRLEDDLDGFIEAFADKAQRLAAGQGA